MPIKPENKKRYPANWKEIRRHILQRANDKCEFCGAENHKPHHETGSTVVLTVAHLNHTPEDCRDENLKALCQKCHLKYDQDHHKANAFETIYSKKGRGPDVARRTQVAMCSKMIYDAQLRGIEYEQKLLSLVPRDELINNLSGITSVLKAKLEGMPKKLGPMLAGKTAAQVDAILKKEVEALLHELNKQFGSVI